MSEHAAVKGRPKRSPSYPAIDLGSALQRAELLYRAERQNAIPVEVAIKHWGYKSPSGRSNAIVSALKKYGLVVDSGTGRSRKIQITDATRRILEHPDSSERLAMIQKAALLPRIHNEMWNKYGASNMPSNDAWAWELKEDLDFTDVGAVDFIKEYRETIRFAKLDDFDDFDDFEDFDAEDPAVVEDIGDDDIDVLAEDADVDDAAAYSNSYRDSVVAKPTSEPRELGHREPTSVTGVQTVTIPIPGGGVVALQGSFPLSEANWDYLEAVLKAMKPGLVKSADPA
ncbi:hypothetical protein [Homoserinimonas hongtaonis]|uniref:Uncharacterized protein n=1 Tax=Homoserinimonas hongtaonis TaxID=2079791 RepID=A0A2U1SZL8_9MICO|nr:hypothetical protein [Salinibacterium hongtaonis]PWB97057.1 hypothetical protein DF220_03805 [Salinibacterium hongtaonis]